jgi:hypothetical protein
MFLGSHSLPEAEEACDPEEFSLLQRIEAVAIELSRLLARIAPASTGKGPPVKRTT